MALTEPTDAMTYLLRMRARNVFEVLEAQALSLADLCEHVAKIRSTFKVRARVRVHQATDMPIGSEKTIDFDVSLPKGVSITAW